MIKSGKIRHFRVIDLRRKILKGWTMDQLEELCKTKLGVCGITATSYIDEAAEPFRKKYQKEFENNLKRSHQNPQN